MKLVATLCASLFFSSVALAEVNCESGNAAQGLQVRVLDTFVGMVAYVNSVESKQIQKLGELKVESFDKFRVLSFENRINDFSLKIKKFSFDPRQPTVYRGQLIYKSINAELFCVID